jgi:hypothetical protein
MEDQQAKPGKLLSKKDKLKLKKKAKAKTIRTEANNSDDNQSPPRPKLTMLQKTMLKRKMV